jgi:2-polyprenyl-3-methyl-5-hydroxy-6-metoxy-1,4-benzoquinol methylase
MNSEKFNPSYVGQRSDILSLIPLTVKSILDVGCSDGSLGKAIKLYDKKIIVHGIEIHPGMANSAKEKIDRVFVGGAQKEIENLISLKNKYDCIIFADILEHLINPWEVLQRSKQLLNNNGKIIISVPNINYYQTFINLFVKRYWPYEDRGIHDRTHLRFFTKKNIMEMLDNSDLEIEKINRNFRLIDRKTKLNKISKFLAIPLLKEFFTFQYILVTKNKH